ncbi:DMT family transporter [Pinirhizobacter soli]|uniref:DMT family transporter n=1 Tax=Pinirhizobacter soli TaxID=2786953 RepID=UPI002029FE0C|nr:DMT family transporter [Pinirhizobacter soli]
MTRAFFFAALCIASWSLIPVVAKVTTQDITPLQFLLLSNVLSAFVCGAVALKRARSFAGPFADARRNLLRTALPGFLGCYLFYLCLYHGYAVGDGMAVLVVQYLWPVLIVLLAPLVTRERIGAVGVAAVLLGFAGSAVVATKGNFTALPAQDLPTLGIVLLGAASFALYSLLSRSVPGEGMLLTFGFFAWGAVFSLVTVLLGDGLALPSSGKAWAGLLLNGCIINGLSYFWWLRALQLAPPSRIAPLVFLAPVLATIWLVVFFHAPFHPIYLLGLALSIAAGLVATGAGRGTRASITNGTVAPGEFRD